LASHFIGNPESTLARIYGCFTVELDGDSSVNLILIENTLANLNGELTLYDLKGSLYKRHSNVSDSFFNFLGSSKKRHKFYQLRRFIYRNGI
jgi:hypothetical protein